MPSLVTCLLVSLPVCTVYVFVPVQVVQGDLLIGVHILSREMDIVTLKVFLLFAYDSAQQTDGGICLRGCEKL